MNNPSTSGLLVSVRSVAEAREALDGGAALIDIKEPSRGALGRADDATIAAIADFVGARLPVSAALGEWIDGPGAIPDANLRYVKWGLAGCARDSGWRSAFERMLATQRSPQVVLAAYADWECARAPSLDDVFAVAQAFPGSVILVDTHCKDALRGQRKPTLIDWLSVAAIEDFCARCRDARLKVALAGSLGLEEIRQLSSARPDWFAVRGAVCADGDRQAAVSRDRVRALVEAIGISPLSPPGERGRG